jgi:hypothetical protein
MNHFFGANTLRKYVGMDDKEELSNFNLPDLFRNFPFQVGNLAAILSISG